MINKPLPPKNPALKEEVNTPLIEKQTQNHLVADKDVEPIEDFEIKEEDLDIELAAMFSEPSDPGADFNLPPGITEDDLDYELESAFSSNNQKSSELTFVSGEDAENKPDWASAGLRARMGTIDKMQDRLDTLVQYSEDYSFNRVWTEDGEHIKVQFNNGDIQYFNPSGLDLGDVAGVSRELGQTGAAILAGKVGAAKGAAIGAAGGPLVATVAALGLGAVSAASAYAATSEISKVVAEASDDKDMVDSRDLNDIMKELGYNFAWGLFAEMTGGALQHGGRWAFRAGGRKLNKIKDIIKQADDLGVPISAAEVVGSPATKTMAAGLKSLVLAGAPLHKAATKSYESVVKTSQKIVDKISKEVDTVKSIGSDLQETSKFVVDNMKKVAGKEYDFIGDKIKDIPVDITRMIKERSRLIKETYIHDDAGKMILDKSGQPMIVNFAKNNGNVKMLTALSEIITDSKNGQLSVLKLKKWRTIINKDINDIKRAAAPSVNEEGLLSLKKLLKDTIADTIETNVKQGKLPQGLMERYNVIQKEWTKIKDIEENILAPILGKVVGKDLGAEDAWKYITSLTAGQGKSEKLQAIKNLLPEANFRAMAANILSRLGNKDMGNSMVVFSPDKFLTGWSKMADPIKDILFGKSISKTAKVGSDSVSKYTQVLTNNNLAVRQELDKLMSILNVLKNAKSLDNTSNTARAINVSNITQSMSAAVRASMMKTGASNLAYGGMAVGGAAAAGVGVAGMAAAGTVGYSFAYFMSRMMVSPKFLKWLVATPATHKSIPSHMIKLYHMSRDDPGMSEGVNQFLEAMAKDYPDIDLNDADEMDDYIK